MTCRRRSEKKKKRGEEGRTLLSLLINKKKKKKKKRDEKYVERKKERDVYLVSFFVLIDITGLYYIIYVRERVELDKGMELGESMSWE